MIAPYGSWRSPITSDLIVAESVGLGQIEIDGDDIYWVESRPSEGGRSVLVRRTPDGKTTDLTPPPYDVRTRVHEYGGGAFAVHDGVVYFSNFADQRLYRQEPGGRPRALTPESDLRYADGVIDSQRGRMVCVREDHAVERREAVNTLVGLDLDKGGPGDVLVSGSDFYSSPRLSPDGSRLAWLAWDHPSMPWDGTELWVGDLAEDGSVGDAQQVAGADDESIFQPEWSPSGVLHFVSDRTGWWNLYRWQSGRVEPLHEMEAEFGVPQWAFGASTYGFASEQRVICAYNQQGTWYIADLDTESLELKTVPTPFTEITRSGLRVSPKRVAFGSGSPTVPESLMHHDLRTGETTALRQSFEPTIDPDYLSRSRAIEFPTEGNVTAHAFFYLPKNRDYVASAGEKPPLLVMSHGGPTGATSTSLNLQVQYWTSRGIAVVDVNYGGSTGYGTAYGGG